MSDFAIKQGDVLPVLNDTLSYNDGSLANLTGASVKFIMRSITALGPTINTTATIVTPVSGTVSYTFTPTDTTTAGRYQGAWVVVFANGKQQQFPTIGYLDIAIDENITTPGGQQIVSLGEVKEYLNIPSTDKTRDGKILRALERATPAIEFICGPIIQRTYQNERYDGGGPWIMLRHRPIVGVNSITEYRGPIAYPLQQIQTPDQGTIYSYQWESTGRIVRRTVGGGQTPFPLGANSVEISYVAGRTTVPANIVEGTCELIRVHFQLTQLGRPRPGGSQTDEIEPGQQIMGFFIPNGVRERLEPSRRHASLA